MTVAAIFLVFMLRSLLVSSHFKFHIIVYCTASKYFRDGVFMALTSERFNKFIDESSKLTLSIKSIVDSSIHCLYFKAIIGQCKIYKNAFVTGLWANIFTLNLLVVHSCNELTYFVTSTHCDFIPTYRRSPFSNIFRKV